VSDEQVTSTCLASHALEIRSKNAGPFWVTMEAFMKTAAGYAIAAELITESAIAELYAVPEESVLIFRMPSLNVVKVSFPRRVPQGSLHDRDIHAGQHHVPLASLPVTPLLLEGRNDD
jgi:hypothetical protein